MQYFSEAELLFSLNWTHLWKYETIYIFFSQKMSDIPTKSICQVKDIWITAIKHSSTQDSKTMRSWVIWSYYIHLYTFTVFLGKKRLLKNLEGNPALLPWKNIGRFCNMSAKVLTILHILKRNQLCPDKVEKSFCSAF